MKKHFFTIFLLVFTLILITPSLTFANQKYDQKLENLSNKGTIEYQDTEITVRSFDNNEEISNLIFNDPDSVVSTANENTLSNSLSSNAITPLSSVIGPNGRSSIVASDSGREIFWSVKPYTEWPYHFQGLIKLEFHSGYRTNRGVAGFGELGTTVSGEIVINKSKGGIAYLTGNAHALNGVRYTVLPGVHTSFR